LRAYVYATLALLGIAMLAGVVRADLQTGGGIEDRFQSTIGNWINFFETNIQWASVTMLDFLKYAIKATYFTVGLVGFVMWASGISRYSGKRLVIGAIAMALASEIIL